MCVIPNYPKLVQNLILSELFRSDLNEYPCDKDFVNLVCIKYTEYMSMYNI